MEKTVSLNVGIDLDGVCSPFEDDLRHFAITELGYSPESVARGGIDDDETQWDFPVNMWGWTPDEFNAACDAAVDAGVLHLHSDPYPGVVGLFERLVERGHKIHIITARNFGTRSAHNSADWLRNHGLHYDALHFLHDKWLVNVDIHLDDSPHTFTSMLEHGSNARLLDRPWNRHIGAGERRVHTYPEFLKAVDDLTALFARTRA